MSLDDEWRQREQRIAEYEAHLAQVYAPELASLARRFDVVGTITNTGGGVTAIEAILGTVPGGDHKLELLVTTADLGLADERSEIVHWYAGLYDGHEGGDALAAGHDVDSFDIAVDAAIRNLRDSVPPSYDVCQCES
ncbi:hypothetical protein [Nocardia sp. bgisy118]|uniref:hypothetical protein n=1 Tax=Nocardia sp. bgisy118 TaxID=3413786 RepID=UPI003F49F3C8